MSAVVENPVLEPIDEAAEKLRSDRLRWRGVLDTLPLVEAEIATAQQFRQAANDAFEAAKVKHMQDTASANIAEQQAEYQKSVIIKAKEKLLETAPVEIRNLIKSLNRQIDEILHIDGDGRHHGLDIRKNLRSQMERYEQYFAETKEPEFERGFERAKANLEKIERQLPELSRRLEATIEKALAAD